jgi:cobalt-zinc-cadmium resistance protein CzcA
MIRGIVQWSVYNPLIVILIALSVGGFGVFAFINVNVEAYPDPAPAIIEIVAQYPGASTEEVERQVTIPLEVRMAGMPGLKYTRTKSLFGLSHMRNQFEYGYDYEKARQEVINRMQTGSQALPAGVVPQLSPQSPTGEIYRYTLRSPKNSLGEDIYTLNDLKALQDWVLEREFRRVPRIIDVTSSGGTVKRYEIYPDPERLRLYGITLGQIQTALSNCNMNAGGDILTKGHTVLNVRSIGLFGGGLDPANDVLHMTNPYEAAKRLREEDNRRIREIRKVVITSNNNVPVRIEHIVEGGPLESGDPVGEKGVVVGFQTRLGRVSLSQPVKTAGPGALQQEKEQLTNVWRDEDEKIQCIVLMRKGEFTLPALADVKKKVEELNDPASGKMLPGVEIEHYYDRGDLVNTTTETVTENLVMGLVLVSVILVMFLSNVRTALIVAINIPLALLFAFSVLYLRGKSANLLSIGAVDFGIIVDSSVILVENVYRSLSAGERSELPLPERVLGAAGEITRALFFSTAIMVCAFIPLFTMSGPEGQLFEPMADTYAFALAGALFFTITLSPVLCVLFFKNLKPVPDNFLVRWIKRAYLGRLQWLLRHRWLSLVGILGLLVGTGFLLPSIGREFMPELEEGNLWITGTFPLNSSLDRVASNVHQARKIISSYPEVEVLVPAIGRPDDGTDPTGYYRVEIFAPLKPRSQWPRDVEQTGWRRWVYGPKRARTKQELVKQMNEELRNKIVGADWNFSQYIRDNVTEAMSGVKGDNAIKIIGPDLDKLEDLAEKTMVVLQGIPGIQEVAIFHIKGQSNLEFRIDLEKCARWGVSAADINNVIQTAVGGKPMSSMVEGEKLFDITLRWPKGLRGSETSILDIPLDVTNNTVFLATGPAPAPAPTGSGNPPPATIGNPANTANTFGNTIRLSLRDFVSPVDPKGNFERAGASTIYREQGKRIIAVKFNVRDRDLGGAVAEAKEKTRHLFEPPYRTVWDGEFQEMEHAEGRLMLIIPLSLGMIFLLLFMAFRSWLDSFVVLSNVLALSLGGIWALWLTDTNFSISAAVGFVSLFGVAIMDGLLLISSFNAARAHGVPLEEAILHGAERRVRAVTMTALTAILGLLPAALSTGIGSQTQKPLAIVVVGGMLSTLFLTRYMMPVLYSFYGHREPPVGTSNVAH